MMLQPDLTAPGVGILAAFSPMSPLSGVRSDNRRVLYNIKSGTSMSCPHATAAAAYIKSFHPSWSPAAIKSALMTTGNDYNSLITLTLYLTTQFPSFKIEIENTFKIP